MANKKRGRPLSENVRNGQFRIRINAQENEMLTAVAKAHGLSKSAYIRKIIVSDYLNMNYDSKGRRKTHE